MTGVPELLVLRLLLDREMYGYELVQAIQVATGEAITLGEGVVYPMLHVLEERGYLKARRKTQAGRARVYYSVTAAGRRRLDETTQEWRRITLAVSQVLNGASHVH